MEVETSNFQQNQRACDNELDFESEFSDFLSRDGPSNNNPENHTRVRRSSNPSIENANTNQRLEYNADGTVNCCDINYGTLVSYSRFVLSV